MKFSFVLVSFLGYLATCHADAVRLQIFGPDGKPVAGAKVHIVESSGYWFRHKTLATRDLQSDGAGMVAFESKKPLSGPKSAGRVVIEPQSEVVARVSAPGLAIGSVFLKAGDNKLALGAAQTFEGTVFDEAQHPVAGVHLVVSRLEGRGQSGTVNSVGLATTTDAKGHFRFEALPVKGTVSIESDDPSWKRETFQLDLAQSVPPLFLERGAAIKGRLLQPDGKPAAGVRFFAGDFEHQPVTRADGTFQVTGLGQNGVSLQVLSDQKLLFVVPQKTVTGLKVGATRDIGDWKAQRGIHLKGQIVMGDTHKPITGASIQAVGTGNFAQGQTDVTGRFDVVTSTGSSTVILSAPGFVELFKTGVSGATKGVLDMGTIGLQRGIRASGIALDEKGNPLAFRSILARPKNGQTSGQWAQTDAAGRFSFDGLDTGDYTLRGGDFKITAGNTFSVGAAPAPVPSLRVVGAGAKSKSKTAKEEQLVQGRVRDLDDHGVAGAKIEMRWQSSDGSSQDQTAISQFDGTFSASFAFSAEGKPKILSVRRPGFSPGSSIITPENGNWRVQIGLQPKGSALRGRVVNTAGQAIAGAYVGLRDGAELPVATDENGNFALEDAPLRNVTLLVSDGPSLVSFEVKDAPQKIDIVLPAAPPAPDKVALADAVLSGARLGWHWKGTWKTLGLQRVELLVGRADATNASKDAGWNQFLDLLARREPKTFLARESELRAQTSAGNALQFEHLLMLARASGDDDGQKSLVRAYLQAQQKEKRDLSAETVGNLLSLAEISARLDPKSAAMWLDYAAQIVAQLPSNGGESAQQWGETLARVQKDAPLSWGHDWKPRSEILLLNSAMEFYSETGDLQTARLAWERSQKLGQQSAKNPAADLKPREDGWPTNDLVQQTAARYVALLARTDPRAALALVPRFESYQQGQLLNIIARNAVKARQLDIARKAIEATFANPSGGIEFCSEAARIAQGFDSAWAATLWPRAYAKAGVRPGYEERDQHESLAPYARVRAAFAPGQSRIIIEREWRNRLALPHEDADDFFIDKELNLKALVEAMTHVSPPRALEMLDKVPERQNMRAQTRTEIALALLEP